VLLIVFGLSGAGKNFVGRILRDDYGFRFYDADDDLTPVMREAIARREIFTDAMRAEFFAIVITRIRELRAKHDKLVVAQAFFKEKYRRLVLETFPEARFVLVESSMEMIEARLGHRNSSAGLEYARTILPAFEPPKHPYDVIHNIHSAQEVKTQLNVLLERIAKQEM
jgi:gluconate kinase